MPRRGSNNPPCRVEGCTNDVQYVTLDLCAPCYQRMLYSAVQNAERPG